MCDEKVEYEAVSGYCFADFDAKTGKLELADNYSLIDYGGDFYAQQSNLDETGRRVMIGWIRMPEPVTEEKKCGNVRNLSAENCVREVNGEDKCTLSAVKENQVWNGMMSLPRVVEIHDGKVYFAVHPNVRKGLSKPLSRQEALRSGLPFCIKTTFQNGDSLNIGGYQISMENGTICADRTKVFPHTDSKKLYCQIPNVGENAILEIFVEPNLIEIFVNDGEYVLSNAVYHLGTEIQGKAEEILTWIDDEIKEN